MARPGLTCLLGLIGALGGAWAHADFPAAMKDVNEGRYEAAREQFLALAELGEVAAQFNYGGLLVNGQGGPKDPGAGVGWVMAALDNGYEGFSREKLYDLRWNLTDEQRKAAEEVLKRYGRAGLQQTTLPVPPAGSRCPNFLPAELVHAQDWGARFYPRSGRVNAQDGLVILELTVGVDGVPRDPEILMSVPAPDFSAAAVDVWTRSRWQPAKEDNVPVESRIAVKVAFNITGGAGVLWNQPTLQATLRAARTGDPTSEYLVGLAATLDPSLGIAAAKAQALIVSAAQGGHPHAQYWVANRFMSFRFCGTERKKIPWLRAAARAGDGSAQLALAVDLVNGQPSAEQFAEARSLLEQAAQSEDFYVMKHVAALLGASPLEALRDPATAKAVADRLMKDPPGSDPQIFEAAAAAYAANRDFRQAESKQQKAITKAFALNWNTREMQERLALYRKAQTWTGDLFKLTPTPAAK